LDCDVVWCYENGGCACCCCTVCHDHDDVYDDSSDSFHSHVYTKKS
jgi:hypothetical protein